MSSDNHLELEEDRTNRKKRKISHTPTPIPPLISNSNSGYSNKVTNNNTINMALSFLNAIVEGHELKYKQFIHVLRKYREDDISLEKVLKQVGILFGGDSDMIERFNKFLPDGYKLSNNGTPEINPSSSYRNQTNSNRQRLKRSNSNSRNNKVMNGPYRGTNQRNNQITMSSTGSSGYSSSSSFDDLLSDSSQDEKKMYTDDENFNNAVILVSEVKKVLQDGSKEYNAFLNTLKEFYRSVEKDLDDLNRKVGVILGNHKELFQKFLSFFPEHWKRTGILSGKSRKKRKKKKQTKHGTDRISSRTRRKNRSTKRYQQQNRPPSIQTRLQKQKRQSDNVILSPLRLRNRGINNRVIGNQRKTLTPKKTSSVFTEEEQNFIDLDLKKQQQKYGPSYRLYVGNDTEINQKTILNNFLHSVNNKLGEGQIGESGDKKTYNNLLLTTEQDDEKLELDVRIAQIESVMRFFLPYRNNQKQFNVKEMREIYIKTIKKFYKPTQPNIDIMYMLQEYPTTMIRIICQRLQKLLLDYKDMKVNYNYRYYKLRFETEIRYCKSEMEKFKQNENVRLSKERVCGMFKKMGYYEDWLLSNGKMHKEIFKWFQNFSGLTKKNEVEGVRFVWRNLVMLFFELTDEKYNIRNNEVFTRGVISDSNSGNQKKNYFFSNDDFFMFIVLYKELYKKLMRIKSVCEIKNCTENNIHKRIVNVYSNNQSGRVDFTFIDYSQVFKRVISDLFNRKINEEQFENECIKYFQLDCFEIIGVVKIFEKIVLTLHRIINNSEMMVFVKEFNFEINKTFKFEERGVVYKNRVAEILDLNQDFENKDLYKCEFDVETKKLTCVKQNIDYNNLKVVRKTNEYIKEYFSRKYTQEEENDLARTNNVFLVRNKGDNNGFIGKNRLNFKFNIYSKKLIYIPCTGDVGFRIKEKKEDAEELNNKKRLRFRKWLKNRTENN